MMFRALIDDSGELRLMAFVSAGIAAFPNFSSSLAAASRFEKFSSSSALIRLLIVSFL